jgi:hypothetical protein
MKIPLLASAILFLAPAALSAAEPSPVGTWEITLSGAEQGLAFATFEEDNEFTGYGLTDDSLGLFTLSGTWTIDSEGRLTGTYTQLVDGGTVNGTLSATVATRTISGSILAENGNFTFKAKPQGTPRNLAGDWEGVATQNRVSLPQSYTLVPTSLPGVFDITGRGLLLESGDFAITGTALVHSSGKVQLLAISDFIEDRPEIRSSLAGTVKPGRKNNLLRGVDSTGTRLQVRLSR